MVKVKAFSLLLAICLVCTSLSGIPFAKDKGVAWSPASAADSLTAQERRPIIVDVYTTWCYYCKVMDATTWANDSVAAYLGKNYHAIKFDAEDREGVSWFGTDYAYKPAYKANMLAVTLLKGNMSFPSTVIIPEKGEWIVIPGAFKAKEIEVLLKYYGERANERMDFDDYRSRFKGKWK